MQRMLKIVWRTITPLVLTVVLALVAFLPTRAAADGEMALDVGHNRGREGDPLDTNDAGGNPGPGDEIQDTAGKTGSTVFGSDFWSLRVLLVPHFDGKTVTFEVLFLSADTRFVEGSDAK